MILSDGDIREAMGSKAIIFSPEPEDLSIQTVSLEVFLGPTLLTLEPNYAPSIELVIDPEKPPNKEAYREVDISKGFYKLPPQSFILGSMNQSFKINNSLVAKLHGCSSLARLGLVPHLQAGLTEPGWEGALTLEIFNFNRFHHIKLRNGMRIGQLTFTLTTNECERPYGHDDLKSRYQGSEGTVISKKRG